MLTLCKIARRRCFDAYLPAVSRLPAGRKPWPSVRRGTNTNPVSGLMHRRYAIFTTDNVPIWQSCAESLLTIPGTRYTLLAGDGAWLALTTREGLTRTEVYDT